MGRSRGGLATKIHVLVYALGRSIRLKLTAGKAYDGRSASDMLGKIGSGQFLPTDRAYDSDGSRENLDSRGAWCNIRAMPNLVQTFAFSGWLYKSEIQWRDSSAN